MISADNVARAIVAACRETGEDPVAAASGVEGTFRSRHYAMWALLFVFPGKLTGPQAARLVGCSGKPEHFHGNSRSQALKGVRPGGGKWWNVRTFERVGAFQALLAQEYGTTVGGKKGNITLLTFDGRERAQVQVADLLEFGPELQAAKVLIDECLMGWAGGSPVELQAIVNGVYNNLKNAAGG